LCQPAINQEAVVTIIHRETVADKSVAVLRDRIIAGELRPGTAVTEEAIAEELGVSRATVRQALNTLMLEGLLTRHPTTRVLQVTTLTTEDVRDIYRARRFLELGGVDAAADASTEELARITDAVQDLEKTIVDEDVEGFVQADSRCHAAVVALLRSQHLSAAHAHLMTKLRLVMIANERGNLEQLAVHLALHKEFARHLRSGSIPQARANLAARLEEAEEALVSQVALLQL
jgi:DNA-binding GntR family transcriptional regulator